MDLKLTMPMLVEAEWQLCDASGAKVLTDHKSHPGAVLSIRPKFYRGQQKPVVFRSVTHGESGCEVKQILRVAGGDGKIRAEGCKEEEILEPAAARFDKTIPPRRRKTDDGSAGT